MAALFLWDGLHGAKHGPQQPDNNMAANTEKITA